MPNVADRKWSTWFAKEIMTTPPLRVYLPKFTRPPQPAIVLHRVIGSIESGLGSTDWLPSGKGPLPIAVTIRDETEAGMDLAKRPRSSQTSERGGCWVSAPPPAARP